MAEKTKEANPLKVVTGSHRLTYVHVKQPTQFEDSEPKYDTTILIPKDHADVAKIENAIRAAYNANKESLFKGLPQTSPKLWNPLRDGDEWLEDHPEAEEYTGMYFIKATAKNQPPVWSEDGEDMLDLDELYSGCYGRVIMQCYAFNKAGNKGFGFFLNGIKKIEDGEPLGGSRASVTEFDEEDAAPAPKARTGAAKSTGTAKPGPGPKAAPGKKQSDVLAAAKAYIDAEGKEAFKTILDAYGVARASELDPAHYEDFIADCALGDGGDDDLL